MITVKKLKAMALNRAAIARRWYGLTDDNAVAEFIADDPDLQAAFDSEAGKNEQLRHIHFMIGQIVAGIDLDGYRERLGDEFVDRVLALAQKARDGVDVDV